MSKLTGLINNKLKLFGFQIKRFKKPNNKWITDLNINTVIDIGANVGQFATEYSKILPKAKFYSFEPIESCFKELKYNTKSLNIECFNVALSNESTKSTINVHTHNPSSSLMKMASLHENLFPHTKGYKEENIVLETLDNILNNRVLEKNILTKIDVQGYESKVIEGGSKTIKKTKILIVEMSYSELYIGQQLFDDLYQKLYSLGFRFKGNISQTVNELNGSIVFSDAVFLNETI